MKTFIPIVCSILLLVYCISFACSDNTTGRKEKIKQQYKEITQQIVYLQDERTGLCYAYYWGGGGNGGPALTLVPYDKVKDYLE